MRCWGCLRLCCWRIFIAFASAANKLLLPSPPLLRVLLLLMGVLLFPSPLLLGISLPLLLLLGIFLPSPLLLGILLPPPLLLGISLPPSLLFYDDIVL